MDRLTTDSTLRKCLFRGLGLIAGFGQWYLGGQYGHGYYDLIMGLAARTRMLRPIDGDYNNGNIVALIANNGIANVTTYRRSPARTRTVIGYFRNSIGRIIEGGKTFWNATFDIGSGGIYAVKPVRLGPA